MGYSSRTIQRARRAQHLKPPWLIAGSVLSVRRNLSDVDGLVDSAPRDGALDLARVAGLEAAGELAVEGPGRGLGVGRAAVGDGGVDLAQAVEDPGPIDLVRGEAATVDD